MEKKNWMTTEQVLETLRTEPDNEQQYCHFLGGCLRATHWLEYSTRRNKFGDSTNWFDYSWYSESEFMKIFDGDFWVREH